MKEKDIICPYCKKFLTKAKVDASWHKLKHTYCGKWIWFVPLTDEFVIKRVPERSTSSGMRFY